MNKTLLSIFFITISFAIVSCGGKNGESTNHSSSSQTAHVSDGEKYISNPDATKFLPDWKKENTVVVHFIGEPDDMHPTNGTSETRTFINHYTQCYVMETDQKALDIRPGIVKSAPVISEDGLRYTYELLDEPTWDDGNPLTVEDIIFTFKANKCPLVNNPHAKPYLDPLMDIVVDASNPRKFTLVMKRKYVQNIIFLTDYGILQRKYFDRNNILSKYSN
jgi:peptide/nickel transport system substrate-binding protein